MRESATTHSISLTTMGIARPVCQKIRLTRLLVATAIIPFAFTSCVKTEEKSVVGIQDQVEFTMPAAEFGDVGYRPSAAFSADGKLLAYVNQSGAKQERSSIRIDRVGGEYGVGDELEIPSPGSRPVDFSFSRDGKRLASMSDSTVQIWDVEERVEVCRFDAPSERPNDQRYVALNAAGSFVVTSWWKQHEQRGVGPYREPRLWIYDARSGQALRELERTDENGYRDCFAFHPSKNLLFGTCDAKKDSRNSRICVWDIDSGKVIHEFLDAPESSNATGFSFSPDQKLVAIATWSSESNGTSIDVKFRVVVYDLSSFAQVSSLEHTDFVFWLTFAPGSERMATVDAASKLTIWSLPTGKQLQTLNLSGASDIAWSSPDRLHVIENSQTEKDTAKLLTIAPRR